MLFFLVELGFLLSLAESGAYVLQERKNDANHSNVDMLLQKTAGSNNFPEGLPQKANLDDESDDISPIKDSIESDESLSIPASDGVPKNRRSREQEPSLKDVVTLIGKTIIFGPSQRMFRSKGHHEPGSGRVMLTVKEILSSPTMKKYVRKLGRKAAVVFRTVETDIQPIASSILRMI